MNDANFRQNVLTQSIEHRFSISLFSFYNSFFIVRIQITTPSKETCVCTVTGSHIHAILFRNDFVNYFLLFNHYTEQSFRLPLFSPISHIICQKVYL